MRNTILTLVLLFATCLAHGQEITTKKSFGGTQFFLDGNRLTMPQLVKTMENNPEAYKQITSARSTNTFAAILSGAGGFMIGYPLGTALAGGYPNWLLAGIGAGLVVVSIPIAQKFNRQAQTAVDLYNQGLNGVSGYAKPEIYFGATDNGIGFRLYF
jgi:hypothetical protein